MERNSSGALRAAGAFGAIGTSDHHAILSSCLLCITRVCSVAAVLRPKTMRPPAAPARGAAATFLRMLVCRRYAASHARLLACSGAAAFGHTAIPASLAGDDASAARYTPQRTRASNVQSFKMMKL